MKAWKVDSVERFHRSLAARVKCTERVRWWEKEGALAKRAEREREGGPRKRTGRKEGRKEGRNASSIGSPSISDFFRSISMLEFVHRAAVYEACITRLHKLSAKRDGVNRD